MDFPVTGASRLDSLGVPPDRTHGKGVPLAQSTTHEPPVYNSAPHPSSTSAVMHVALDNFAWNIIARILPSLMFADRWLNSIRLT